MFNDMGVTNQSVAKNDYAVAKVLNDQALAIIFTVIVGDTFGMPDNYEINELNRAYILLVAELQKLYDHNPALAEIKPEPIWRRFDVLRTSTWEINDYATEISPDEMKAHGARLEKLCIVSGVEEPHMSAGQKKLIDNAKTAMSKYNKIANEVNKEQQIKKESERYIPKYTLTYKPDGSILVNDVMKLKKAHAGSTTERLLEQSLKNPNTLFKPNLGQTARNISTVLNSAGFTKELRALFFPTVSKDNGIVFRPTITREQADTEKIDTVTLDNKLKELGAVTEPKM